MLKYKLCKKLKDAGFPKDGFYFEEEMPEVKVNGIVISRKEDDYWRNEPTLSELIEACRDKISSIHFYQDNTCEAKYIRNGDEDLIGEGETPEEAVANLYLKLKKVS